MPTYAYRCKDCGHAFDAVQSFTDDSLTVCPECGGSLRKQYGSVGVTFKGSGFYRTDSRGAASSGTTPAGTSGSTSSGGAGTAGGEKGKPSGSAASTAPTGGSGSSSAS